MIPSNESFAWEARIYWLKIRDDVEKKDEDKDMDLEI